MKASEFVLALFSVLCLVANQILIKIWIEKNNVSVWPPNFQFLRAIFSLEVLIVASLLVISGVIWVYLLGKVQFSMLYPIISLSYVFGILAAKFIFYENIPLLRWIGVIIIIVGVLFVTKK